jgi:ABC-2 type transport system ATP-binding protein
VKPAIEVRHLVKRYRAATTNAVDDVSFDVPAGTWFCLLGPNGAGKTTTVSILTTTLIASSGDVRIAGLDLASQQAMVRRRLGIVFQQQSLDLNLTAEENVRLHAVLYGLAPWRPTYRMMPATYRSQVQDLAGVLGIVDALGRPTRTLSGGTRRKLEIVRALMHQPSVLFLDEPTTGLDAESRRGLWAYVHAIRDRFGTTVFLTTHYLEEAEAADHLCVMMGGRIVERGAPGDLKARYTRPELILDASDRAALRRELMRLDLPVDGPGPVRVSLDGLSAQHIVSGLGVELTRLEVRSPTLEDAYLRMLDGDTHAR